MFYGHSGDTHRSQIFTFSVPWSHFVYGTNICLDKYTRYSLYRLFTQPCINLW